MDISTSESAYLSGKARFETWKSDWTAQYYRPVTDQMMLMVVRNLMTLPPQVKEGLKARQPEAWRDIEKIARDNKLEV